MNRLLLFQDIALPVEESNDSGVPPEVDGHVLEPGDVGAELRCHRTLIVTNPKVFQDVPLSVEHQESFITTAGVYSGFSLGVAAEIAHHDPVCVIPQFAI